MSTNNAMYVQFGCPIWREGNVKGPGIESLVGVSQVDEGV